MKAIHLYLSILITLCVLTVSAQNLESLDTIVHYTLINTAADQRGNYEDIELINTPYENEDGVYCNGLYINGFNPDGSLVRTPPIDELYDSTFAVQAEFRIDSLPSGVSPIFICGDSYRYLGMIIRWDGTIMYSINDTWYQIPSALVTTSEWHTATAVYQTADTTATFWLDGQLIATVSEALNRSDNDKQVSNTDYGMGATLEGNLRNIIVFSSDDILSNTETPVAQSTGYIFPNPTADVIHAQDIHFTSWTICDMAGKQIAHGNSGNGQPINVSTLPEGAYTLFLENKSTRSVSQHRFIKL